MKTIREELTNMADFVESFFCTCGAAKKKKPHKPDCGGVVLSTDARATLAAPEEPCLKS